MLPYDLWASDMAAASAPGAGSGDAQSRAQLEPAQSIAKCDIVRNFCAQLMGAVVSADAAGPSQEGTASDGVAGLPDGVVAMHLGRMQEALAALATTITARERARFASFTALHRAAMGQYAATVRRLEGQVEQLGLQRDADQRDLHHRVQCALADKTLHLVLEVTALRSKVSRMRVEKTTQERDIRERVKREYDGLVNNLFSASFALKNRFEEYRLSLHDDVVQGLYEVRWQGSWLLRAHAGGDGWPLCRPVVPHAAT